MAEDLAEAILAPPVLMVPAAAVALVVAPPLGSGLAETAAKLGKEAAGLLATTKPAVAAVAAAVFPGARSM